MANRWFTYRKLCLLLLAAPLLGISNAAAEITLSFGIYAADKPTIVVKKFKPALKVLEKSLTQRMEEPVRIKLQVASTYEIGITNLTTGKVDFARLGPASYVEAKERQSTVKILALESKKGEKRFNGVICVAANSSINSPADLKGKRFAFGDQGSTIGRYLSQQFLLEQGIRANDLKEYDYLKRHDKVGSAVAAGQFDAGALKESTYKRLVADGSPLKVLATFPNVTKPWIARSELDQKIFLALKSSLLEMVNTEDQRSLKKNGFVEGNDSDFALIRKAIKQNSLFFSME